MDIRGIDDRKNHGPFYYAELECPACGHTGSSKVPRGASIALMPCSQCGHSGLQRKLKAEKE